MLHRKTEFAEALSTTGVGQEAPQDILSVDACLGAVASGHGEGAL
jgi:hypothetical protein